MWASGVRAWEQGGFEWRSRLRWGSEGALCGLREIRALSGARGSGDLSALGVPLENWRTRVRSVWYSKIKRNNGRM